MGKTTTANDHDRTLMNALRLGEHLSPHADLATWIPELNSRRRLPPGPAATGVTEDLIPGVALSAATTMTT